MSKKKKHMKPAKRKLNKDNIPIKKVKATPPTATHKEDGNIHSANFMKWANKCGVTDTDLKVMLSSQLLLSYTNSTEALALFQNGILAMHNGIGPKDTTESLLAAQMVAVHNMAMEFSKRAMLSGQHPDGVNANVNRVTKLMRTFTTQMETLKKYRTGF